MGPKLFWTVQIFLIKYQLLWTDLNCKKYISFSSSNTQFYKWRIFCLFTFSVFFPDKSFELISKYKQKCQFKKIAQLAQKFGIAMKKGFIGRTKSMDFSKT